MKYKFTPHHIVINDLFGNDLTYIIPEYQRPYSWDSIGKSEKNNQVNVMWDDLISFYESGETGEYFFGSMVMIEKEERVFEVVDGQQRLTTIVLLFVAIKCFLKGLREENLVGNEEEIEKLKVFIANAIKSIDDIIFNKEVLGLGLNEIRKVRIEKNADFDYDVALEMAINCEPNFSKSRAKPNSEQDDVIARYFKNRKYLENRLTETFTNNHRFDYQQAVKINDFSKFLKNRLAIVQIKAVNFEAAFHIFEILNNRGLPLSSKDLLRNFLLKEFDKLKNAQPGTYKNLNPADKWHQMENDYNFSKDFISRWIESRKASKQKFSAFNDLKEIYEKNYSNSLDQNKVEIFYEDLLNGLKQYTYLTSNTLHDKQIEYKLAYLFQGGNTQFSTNLLLALFIKLDYDGQKNQVIRDFLTAYEQYVTLTLLAPAKRFSSKPIFAAIREINNGNINAAKKEFALDDKDKELLAILINGKIIENANAKLLLAKYVWKQQLDTQDDVVNQELIFDRATLEHIIPQKPANNTNWISDFDPLFIKDFTYKLGNMTLLTQKLNSSAKNREWDFKKAKYQFTKLPITQNFTQKTKLDEDFFRERQKEIIKKILEDLKLN